MRKILYGFLSIIVIAVISIPFIDWQSFKEPILNKIQETSGCRVQLNGPLQIKLFPSPQIILNQAFVEPKTQTIKIGSLKLVSAKVKNIYLSWAWLPLLKGKLEIHHFNLEEPFVSLQSIILEKTQSSLQEPSENSSKIPSLALHDFSIHKGKVLIDAQTTQQKEVDQLDCKGSISSLEGPAELTGSFNYNDIKINGNISLKQSKRGTPFKGTVTVDYQNQNYGPLFFKGNLQNGNLNMGIQAKGLQIPDVPKPVSFKGDITYQQNLLKTQINLEEGTDQLSIQSQTDIEKEETSLYLNGKKLSYLEYFIENLKADIKIKAKDIIFNKIEANIFEGVLNAKGHLHPNQKLDLQGNLSKINLTKIPALKDSPLKKGRLKAVTNLSVNLKDPPECLKTLNGDLHLNVTEGEIETLDVEALTTQFKKINNLSNLAEGIELTKKRKIMGVHNLSADFQIHQGQAKTENIRISADPADITGQGTINLAEKLLNLKLAIKIKALGNLTFPFVVTGPWEKPEYGINQEQLGALVTKSYGEKIVSEVMNQVQKHTQKASDNSLQDGKPAKNLKPEQIAKNLIGNLLR